MAVPPRDPWHRRYWGYYSRPYTGCGCLYTIIVIVLIWALLSWFFAWPWFWTWPR